VLARGGGRDRLWRDGGSNSLMRIREGGREAARVDARWHD
jgi:hypothetical protein